MKVLEDVQFHMIYKINKSIKRKKEDIDLFPTSVCLWVIILQHWVWLSVGIIVIINIVVVFGDIFPVLFIDLDLNTPYCS